MAAANTNERIFLFSSAAKLGDIESQITLFNPGEHIGLPGTLALINTGCGLFLDALTRQMFLQLAV